MKKGKEGKAHWKECEDPEALWVAVHSGTTRGKFPERSPRALGKGLPALNSSSGKGSARLKRARFNLLTLTQSPLAY